MTPLNEPWIQSIEFIMGDGKTKYPTLHTHENAG